MWQQYYGPEMWLFKTKSATSIDCTHDQFVGEFVGEWPFETGLVLFKDVGVALYNGKVIGTFEVEGEENLAVFEEDEGSDILRLYRGNGELDGWRDETADAPDYFNHLKAAYFKFN